MDVLHVTPRERAEAIAEEQLKDWPTGAPFGILRTAIRNDLMVPAIERALAEENAKSLEDVQTMQTQATMLALQGKDDCELHEHAVNVCKTIARCIGARCSK